MKKSTIILMHIGYWVTYVLFTFGIIAFSKDKFDLGDNFIGPFLGRIFLGAAYFYLFYYYLVPKFLAKRESKRFLRLGLGFCLLSGPVEVSYYFLTTNADTTIDRLSWQESVVAILNWMVLFIYYAFMAFVNGMMGAFLKGFITWYDEIHVKEVLIRKNVETELALLKAKLNPHFLFNTLNNIDVLIEKNATVASVYLKKLSDIMRFTLYDAQEEAIPLTQELEYIRKFIDLQHIRTTNEFAKFELIGDPRNVTIAPMIFIPFIENAFKHSTNKKIDRAIDISIKITDNRIFFSCVNMIDKETAVVQQKGGLGLDLIRQRLQILYKDLHSLEVARVNDMFNVSLMLNLHAN